MNVNDACAFFTELCLRHRVPSEMHFSNNSACKIHIDRTFLSQEVQDLISEQAKARGFKVEINQFWMNLR